MGKKGQLAIYLRTVPNGYTLDMAKDGTSRGYMYFTLNELLEGFMYHVGLGEMGAVNKDDIKVFLSAIARWQDNKQLVREKIQDEAEIAQLQDRVSQLSGLCREQAERIAELRGKNKELRALNKELASKVDGYEKENGRRAKKRKSEPNTI